MWRPCMQGLTLLSLVTSAMCDSHLAKLFIGLIMFAFIFHDLRNVELFHYSCRQICCFYIGQVFIVWSFFAAILVNDQYIIVVNYNFSQYKKIFWYVIQYFSSWLYFFFACPCLLDFYWYCPIVSVFQPVFLYFSLLSLISCLSKQHVPLCKLLRIC